MLTPLFIAWREVKAIVMSLIGASLLGLWLQKKWLLWSALALLSWVAYFFRDPERYPAQAAPNLILAPADGRVTHIERIEEPLFIKGEVRRISIFLSLFDVHVQRASYSGTVQYLHYQPGDFAPAFLKDTHSNEFNLIGLTTPHGPLVIKQIAGILARRIVCRVQPGDKIATGQRLGLIKFGSRVDLLLPPDAEVTATIGQQVYGGESIIARWP